MKIFGLLVGRFLPLPTNGHLSGYNILGSLFSENTVQVVPLFWYLLCFSRCTSFFFFNLLLKYSGDFLSPYLDPFSLWKLYLIIPLMTDSFNCSLLIFRNIKIYVYYIHSLFFLILYCLPLTHTGCSINVKKERKRKRKKKMKKWGSEGRRDPLGDMFPSWFSSAWIWFPDHLCLSCG